MGAGRFVAVEGPKGVGKTALCAALTDRLTARTRDHVVVTKEPTPAFDLRNEQTLRGIHLARAIAADRQAHVAGVIGPALAEGKGVVCDRYILSSYVFHIGDGVRASMITRLNGSFPMPSLNLVLHAAAEVISKRRTLRGKTTRLQTADSEYEFSEYIRYAKLMECVGIPYEVWDNSNQDAQHAIADRLLWLLCLNDWNPS